MHLTKEIIYKYLKESLSISEFLQDPNDISIYYIDGNPVVVCEDNGIDFISDDIHLDLSLFTDWLKNNREQVLNRLLD